ncbi:PAS domain-containing protein [Litoreibacter roseus]|uniref:histidine kinase n=1 Tax=Litoreibacter roseus TaxID=2601869 RepID=A0A6N6JEC9_9RHOB|nr:PAS domain-containing protein [Litoreibacter roseus]GFE63729.1 hypothetical protein KIN_08030 [Litoreibacter roseus]
MADAPDAADTKRHYLEVEFETLLSDPQTFQFLDQGAVDGFWYWDLENPEHEWMSPGFWRALGFDPEKRKHLASEWQDLIYPEDGAAALKNFERHCADPSYPYDQLVRYKTSDGGTVTIRCRGKAMRENGVPKRMLGAHTIVHDTRSHALDRQLSQLVDMSGDAILAWSLQKGVVRWNRGATQLYKTEEAEALGRNPNELTQAEFGEDWATVQAQVMAGQEWVGDVQRISKDGGLVITSTRIHRVHVGTDETLFFQIDRDITARHMADMKERQLTRELHHRVKNLFSVIQSLVRMSAQYENDAPALAAKIRNRIKALAISHVTGMEKDAETNLDLRRMVDAITRPHRPHETALSLSGPTVTVPKRAATPLGMILHELAINALEHGAWSEEDGRTDVSWQLLENGTEPQHLEFVWKEQRGDGSARAEQGNVDRFGTKLMTISVAQLNGRLEREWRDGALSLRLDFSIEEVAA